MAVLGPGRGAQPPRFRGHPWFFCKYNTNTQIFYFFVVPNCRKLGKFAASIERSNTKSDLASGELRPLTPDQGVCPWTPLWALPPDPRYRLALPRSPSGRAGPPRPVLIYIQVIRRIRLLGIGPISAIFFSLHVNICWIEIHFWKYLENGASELKNFKNPLLLTPCLKILSFKNGVKKLNSFC